jgi:hypothetical protein
MPPPNRTVPGYHIAQQAQISRPRIENLGMKNQKMAVFEGLHGPCQGKI